MAQNNDEDAVPVTTEPTEEDKVEASTEAAAEAEEKEGEEEEELEECTCPHCGERVVPIPVKTRFGGKSYRCSECGKFFKPTPGEEEGVATEKAGEGKGEEEKPLEPLDVEMTERIKTLLPQYLPRVYGIPKGSKRIQAIIDTITPEQTADPWNLHAHIKNFAPEADDRHLEAIITKIFSTLEHEGFVQPMAGPRYTPRYGRRGYGPRYPSRGGYQRQRPGYRSGYPDEWGEDEEYEVEGGYPQRRPPKPVKVVVDGQTIETDVEGMMAWKRFKLEDNQAKQETREHELRMKRIEEEIKNIAKGGSEEKVAVKVGDQTINVPSSVAPFILKGGGESEEMKALRAQVSATEKRLEDKEKEELKGQLAGLYSKLSEIENRDPLEAVRKFDDYAIERGFSRTGKSTVDLIGELADKADKRAQQLISRTGPRGEGEGEGEFRPEVKRTLQERQQLAGKIQGQLEKREEILEAENELLAAARS